MFRSKTFLGVLSILTLAMILAFSGFGKAQAATKLKLVDDKAFVDTNRLTVKEIQSILSSAGGFLKNFSQHGRSAAQIIWDAAHGHGDASGENQGISIHKTVNPAVLLATLQKEQSLLTMKDRNDRALDVAMGFGCPDGGGCDSKYEGFTEQVENAAWQLRFNYERAEDSGFSDYQVGDKIAVDDKSIIIGNRATSSLLRYTPHYASNKSFASMFNKYNSRSAAARAEAKAKAIAKAKVKAAEKAVAVQKAKAATVTKAAVKAKAAVAVAKTKVDAKTKVLAAAEARDKAAQTQISKGKAFVKAAAKTKAAVIAATKTLDAAKAVLASKEAALVKAQEALKGYAPAMEAAQKALEAAKAEYAKL